jgi:hypothetical protein
MELLKRMKKSKSEAEADRRHQGGDWARSFIGKASYSELAMWARTAARLNECDQWCENVMELLPTNVVEEMQLHESDDPWVIPASSAEEIAFCEGFYEEVAKQWQYIEENT